MAPNFFPILRASSSLLTRTVFLITSDFVTESKTDSSINLQICSVFSGDNPRRVLALEKVFTGIIAPMRELDMYLFHNKRRQCFFILFVFHLYLGFVNFHVQ